MKFLFTGAAGMLGSALIPAFTAAGHEIVATDIDLSNPSPWGDEGPTFTHLDVREPTAVADAIAAHNVDFLCHLAAETNLEVSDEDPAHAYLTNTVATKYAALAARAAGIPMVYISTAGVFDGLKEEAYHEWDPAIPLNLYGKTKYEGEAYVERWVPEYYIVRAGWMVGGGPGKDHKFVAKMIDQIQEGRTVLHAVGDKLGTPTYAPDFAKCLLGLIASGSYGRYHMAGEGEGSRVDVAQEIVDVLGLTDKVTVEEVTSDYFAEEFPSNRPRSEIMQNMHLELQGLNTMRPWRVALREYLELNFAHLASGNADTESEMAAQS